VTVRRNSTRPTNSPTFVRRLGNYRNVSRSFAISCSPKARIAMALNMTPPSATASDTSGIPQPWSSTSGLMRCVRSTGPLASRCSS
jgi:hypothetical protein